MTTTSKITCSVTDSNPPAGVNTTPTVFRKEGESWMFVSGAGYIDGMKAHITDAFESAMANVKYLGFSGRVSKAGYYYHFKGI